MEQKKCIGKKWLSLLTLSLLLSILFGMNACAAKAPKFAKTAMLFSGNPESAGVMGSVKTDKILKLKSSNPKVVAVKKEFYYGEHNIKLIPKKAGTATVSFTLKRKNGKTYSFKTKVKVYNYEKPVSKISIGKNDYTKLFNKEYINWVKADPVIKGKLKITMKKGFKLTGLYLVEGGTGKEKKIKNGSMITLDATHYIRAEYKNTKKNYSYGIFLGGKQ